MGFCSGDLLAVPYGALADKYGRRWILTLGLAGAECTMLWIIFVCYFQLPLKLTWFSLVLLNGAVKKENSVELI